MRERGWDHRDPGCITALLSIGAESDLSLAAKVNIETQQMYHKPWRGPSHNGPTQDWGLEKLDERKM